MSGRFSRTHLLALTFALLLPAGSVRAHCDGMDGPVVKAARRALETGDINPALIWVRLDAEPEVKAAFQQALDVRRLSPAAKELADRYFFETLVRLHRAGEGEPYTGLKPAGRDLGPAIPAADRAVESGSPEQLTGLVSEALHRGIETRLAEVRRARELAAAHPDHLENGRRFVQAYVAFLHYVERVYSAAAAAAAAAAGASDHSHAPETADARADHR